MGKIDEIKNNVINANGFLYIKDIIPNESGEIFKFWKPVITSVYDGFFQIDKNKIKSHKEISDIFWDKISCNNEGFIHLKISLSNNPEWLEVKINHKINLIKPFDVYMQDGYIYCEDFVAVDINEKYMFSVQNLENKLALFYMEVEKSNDYIMFEY